MSMKQLILIYGGRSTEHEISVKSARNIAKVDLKVVSDINAYDMLLRKRLLRDHP